MACGNNCMYMVAPPLREFFVDKTSGLPLSAGTVSYFKQSDHNTYKAIYAISGTPEDPVYTPIENPQTLTSAGTVDQAVYLYPFDDDGNLELYYIEVKDAGGVLQFTQDLWPPDACAGMNPDSISGLQNFFSNPQFRMHLDVPATASTPAGQITLPITNLAPGGWQFEVDSGFTSINTIEFDGFNETVTDPPANPPFLVQVICSSPNPAETMKDLQKVMTDVNFLAGQLVTFQFYGLTASGTINVQLVIKRNYGPGGSAPDEEILDFFTLTNDGQDFTANFTLSDNSGKVIDSDVNTTSITFALRLPSALLSDSRYTNFALVQGAFAHIDFPSISKEQDVALTMAGSLPVPAFDGSDDGKLLRLKDTGDYAADGLIRIEYIAPSNPSNGLFYGGNFSTNPWQRGVTSTITAPGSITYVADRFRFNYGTARTTNVTYSKGTNVPSILQAGLYTFTSLKLVSNSTDVLSSNNPSSIEYVMEGYDFQHIAQRNFVISFWLAAPAGIYGVVVTNLSKDRSITFQITVSVSNVVQFFSIKLPPSPAAGGWNYAEDVGIIVSLHLVPIVNTTTSFGQWITTSSGLPAGTANQFNFFGATNNVFELSLFNCNPGIIALPFQEPAFPDLLTRLQRYYEKSYALQDIPGTANPPNSQPFIASTISTSGDSVSTMVSFVVKKRIKGDSTRYIIWSPVTGTANRAYLNGSGDRTPNGLTLYYGDSNLTIGRFNGDGNSYIYYYTADADFY